LLKARLEIDAEGAPRSGLSVSGRSITISESEVFLVEQVLGEGGDFPVSTLEVGLSVDDDT